MRMVDDKLMVSCFLCQREFQFGPHRYAGRGIGAWKIQVCDGCYKGNWDGIVLDGHPRLKHHLEELGIPIKFNAKGWLSWPE